MKNRKVIYSEHELAETGNYYVLKEKGEAIFHEFGVGFEELENGVGNYSTAILELEGGRIVIVAAEHVRFISNKG